MRIWGISVRGRVLMSNMSKRQAMEMMRQLEGAVVNVKAVRVG